MQAGTAFGKSLSFSSSGRCKINSVTKENQCEGFEAGTMSLLTVPYCKCARPFFSVYMHYESAFKYRADDKEI